jgi:mannose-1-phosphate guanylyltransferase
MYAVIMAGGRGERFWPLSRKQTPKQLLRIVSEKTMIEETVERMAPLIPRDNVYIATGQHLYQPIKKVLSDVNYVLEPVARNTAACIGLATIQIMERDPAGIVIVETSDHVYRNKRKYLEHIRSAEELARDFNKIVLVGIQPTYPSTGFGYIHEGQLFREGKIPAYYVKEFKEKPVLETARDFLAAGGYLWNSGVFVFKCAVMLEAIGRHLPRLYAGLMEIKKAHFDDEAMAAVFEGLESISIDYGVMEKTNKTVVLRAAMDWDDVGDWLAMERWGKPDPSGNVITGEVVVVDTKNCIIVSDKLVAAVGVNDLVIVNTPDAVLVCHKSRVQDVKTIVRQVDKKYT